MKRNEIFVFFPFGIQFTSQATASKMKTFACTRVEFNLFCSDLPACECEFTDDFCLSHN